MEKKYYLYSDEKQTELIASANDIDDIIFESKFCKEGCWFEYDMDGKFLCNERVFGFDQFPEEPEERYANKIEADDRVTFSTTGGTIGF